MTEIPDEIEDRLADLEGQFRALHNARKYLLEQVEKLEEENAELWERLNDLEQMATTTYGLAGVTSDCTRADGGGASKQKRAEWLSRNEVVRRAITGNYDGGAVTVSGVTTTAPDRSSRSRHHRSTSKLSE